MGQNFGETEGQLLLANKRHYLTVQVIHRSSDISSFKALSSRAVKTMRSPLVSSLTCWTEPASTISEKLSIQLQ